MARIKDLNSNYKNIVKLKLLIGRVIELRNRTGGICIQWGIEIRTSLDFKWSKRGSVANGLDFEWDQ